MANKVVAHYLDGRILKGTSLDVDLDRPVCHLTPAGERHGTVEVALAELKALYFVKDFAGHPRRDDLTFIDPDDIRARGAHHMSLQFSDGERLTGLTVHYPPTGPFFFLLPADPASNNLRILVNRAAVTVMAPTKAAAG